MVTDAVFLDQVDEIVRRVPRQGGFVKIWVFADEIRRPSMNIGEITSPPAADQNLLSDLFRVFEDQYLAAPRARGDRAKQSGRAGADYNDVFFHFRMNSPPE